MSEPSKWRKRPYFYELEDTALFLCILKTCPSLGAFSVFLSL